MCFHSRAEYLAYIRARQRRQDAEKRKKERDKHAQKHAKTKERYALIVLRDATGEWVAGWHCNPRDPQDVANTILDLKTWHKDEFRYVDMSDVDKERARLKLKPLDENGLPLPDRAARASVDDELDEMGFRELMENERNKAALSAIEQMERKRRTAGRPLHDGGEISKSSVDALPANFMELPTPAERAALAKQLGVTMEELRTMSEAEIRAAARA